MDIKMGVFAVVRNWKSKGKQNSMKRMVFFLLFLFRFFTRKTYMKLCVPDGVNIIIVDDKSSLSDVICRCELWGVSGDFYIYLRNEYHSDVIKGDVRRIFSKYG